MGQLQSVRRDSTLSTAFFTSGLHAAIADTTRADDLRLATPLRARRDHASEQSQTLWANDRLPPKQATAADQLATSGQPRTDKLRRRDPVNDDSYYVQSTHAEKAQLVTVLAALD